MIGSTVGGFTPHGFGKSCHRRIRSFAHGQPFFRGLRQCLWLALAEPCYGKGLELFSVGVCGMSLN